MSETKNNYNSNKALNAILYILSNAPIPDKHHIIEIMYFADRYHSKEYGSLICGEKYFEEINNSIPSKEYLPSSELRISDDAIIKIADNKLIPLRSPDLKYLTKSNILCIDKAIIDIGNLTFLEFVGKIYDAAVSNGKVKDEINIQDLTQAIIIEYKLLKHCANFVEG